LKKENIGYLILLILSILVLSGMMISSPIEQNSEYHNFSDTKSFFGVPNFWNVISNLPFAIIGFLGLSKLNSIATPKTQYLIFFLGIICVSIGSGYYHWNPNDSTLVWDRLPMTIVFMALVSIIISEFISSKHGRLILYPAILVGLLSVVYWMIFNDLRFYAMVQFYPMVAIPVILIFFKSKYNLTIGYWLLLLAYVIAKVLEYYDVQVNDSLAYISGHSLKHIFASIGLFALLYTYIKRRKVA
jgi:hypothetical protein